MEWIKRSVIALTTLLTLEVEAATLPELMARCAPSVHPSTLAQIIQQESGGQMYVLSDSGPAALPWSVRKGMVRSFSPATLTEATGIVKELLNQGHLVDVGLMQVNTRHLGRMGLSIEDALDPCKNLMAGSKVLVEFYLSALERYKEPSKALVAAISAYNTGSFQAGVANGYVRKVLAVERIPELKVGRGTVLRVRAAANAGQAQLGGRGDDVLSERAARLASTVVETF